MSGFEIAGISLAVAGLLLSIRGAVDGYNLLSDIFEKDNGLRFAKTQYYVEQVKLKVWAERFKVDDEVNCLLLKQPQITRDAVWRIIAEINATHELAINFIAKYHIEPVALPTAAAAGKETFHRQSKWVAMISDARAQVKQEHRISWAAKDRDQLNNLISRLGVLNKDLWDVVTPEETDTVRIITGILSGLSDQLSLDALQRSASSSPASLLALGTQLKKMQSQHTPDLAAKAKKIDKSELSIWNAASNDTSTRFRGTHTGKDSKTLPEPVWIEWKPIENTNKSMDLIIQRIEALGALLSTPNAAAFHRPTCLGIYDDLQYKERNHGNRRVGLVYRSPDNDLPVPLSQLLRTAASARTRPPLGDRFALAYKLASAVSLFHATDWIHKSLRSDNILFTSSSDITAPQISGFQYSRPASDASLEGRPVGKPELDLYYHPQVINGRWTKIKEMYSLGIILLEIAHWRPVFEERFRKMSIVEVSWAILADLHGKFGEDLAGLVGREFVDVIKCCLTGSFGVPNGMSSVDESRALNDAVFQKVVKVLAFLKA